MTLLGRALSRDAAYYTLAMASVFPLGIATALLTTHYLEPADYGQLGLLMIFASLATILYGLGIIQGTLMWAYGQAGDDGDDDGGGEDLGPVEGGVAVARAQRRQAMGSGLVLATMVAIVGTTTLIALAEPVADLIASPSLKTAVIWAALSSGFGAVWRLATQVFRMERRPAMYLIVHVSRPVLALVLTAVLLSRGYGLEGAVAAIAIGTALSLVLALCVAAPSYKLGFRPADWAEIFRRGRKFIPIVIAVFLVTNADLWVLSRFAPGPEVGYYRLASRFGVFPGYVTSAYLMAWLPMQRSSIFQAAVRARSRGSVSSTMFTYYCIGAMGLLLLLAVCSELFIGLAPASYAAAAPFVPAVAAAASAHGANHALYRIGRFKYRRPLYVAMLTLAAAVLAFLGSALAGPLGGWGVALAGTIGSLMGAAGFVIAIQRGKHPIPFQWRRIGGAVAIGTVLIVGVGVSPLTGVARVAQDVVAIVLYLVLLVVTGVVPRHVVGDVAAVGRAVSPVRGGRKLADRVERLPPDQRDAILRWVGREVATGPPTLEVDPEQRESLAALTAGVRAVAGQGTPSDRDAEIGVYLTYRGSPVDRDLLAEELVAKGIDALELHLLDDAYKSLRQWRRRLPRDPHVATGLAS